MKKYLIVLIFLITLPNISFAFPVIENVSVNPQSLWLGESTIISLNCYDNENKTITKVYADIIGPGIILPRLDFIGNYNLLVDKAYLDRAGKYDVTIFCNNSDNQNTSVLTSFTVSKLTGYVSSIQPKPAYIGDIIEIDFFVKKDDIALSSGVSFNVTLNDQVKQLKIPPAYDIIKGWILKIDSPSTEGIYDVKVYASYDRTSISNSSSIEIRKKVEFEIVSMSKNWVEGNENITINLKAKDRGNVIDVNKNNLNVQIASVNLNILSIDRNGDLYDVRITAPAISTGRYEIRTTLSYEGSSYSATKPIDYIVTVKGKIVDSSNKGISTQIKFFSNNVEKLKLITDSAGYYSGSLPPDTYDVQIIFLQSTLYLKGVSINNFNDPIKYFYSTEPLVPGIRNAGLFGYEIALTYYEANIEMNYDERNVFDETDLVIFKCSNWNSGRKVCNDKWFEIGGDIDTVRNLVKVNINSLSAFVIGERKTINVNFNLDNQKYYTGSTIKVRGLVKDLDGDTVSNATIKAYVKNTSINIETFSDNNGVFSFELKAPEEEGNYNLALNIEKSPYISFNDSKSFDVVKSRAITIVVPDTIKLKQGQNFTQEFSIVNIGQADLSNLNISLTGIPSNYYNMTNFIEKLKENEEGKTYIYFSIPEDAEKKTYSANLIAFNNEIRQEKIFGFTITGKNETVESPIESTGRFILPKIDFNMIYIIVFAVFCFSVAIIIKKIKVKRSKRDDIKEFLFDIKSFLRKRKNEIIANVKSDYENLISSEFPNALKDIKDEYGKDN